MVINKTTSNALLVSTLVVYDSTGKPVKDVTEFDTDTLKATLGVGGPVTAGSFMFMATSDEDLASLYGLLDSALEPHVTMSGKKYKAKKAMSDIVTPDDYLTFNAFNSPLQLHIATCTNCSTKFLLFLDGDGELWTGEKVGGGDTFQTLTQVDETGLTCDSCSNNVAMFDVNPW